MPFASLEEVYGENFTNKSKKKEIEYYNGLTPMKELNTYKVTSKPNDHDNYENENDEQLDSILNDIELENEDMSHSKFLNHFKNCKKCQRIISKKLNNKPQITETFENNSTFKFDNLIIILLGIFIIFILDAFLKIGKYF